MRDICFWMTITGSLDLLDELRDRSEYGLFEELDDAVYDFILRQNLDQDKILLNLRGPQTLVVCVLKLAWVNFSLTPFSIPPWFVCAPSWPKSAGAAQLWLRVWRSLSSYRLKRIGLYGTPG